jgi:hypothetical protein
MTPKKYTRKLELAWLRITSVENISTQGMVSHHCNEVMNQQGAGTVYGQNREVEE